MLASELGNVPLQVLRADLVEGAFVGAFQHRPEGLDAVRVRHAVNILADRVLDALVVVPRFKNIVDRRIVRVDLRAVLRVGRDKPRRVRDVGSGNVTGPDFVGLAVFHADHGSLAVSAAPGASQFLPLAVGHVPTLAAKVRFISLYRTVKRVIRTAIVSPRLRGADEA